MEEKDGNTKPKYGPKGGTMHLTEAAIYFWLHCAFSLLSSDITHTTKCNLREARSLPPRRNFLNSRFGACGRADENRTEKDELVFA